MMRPLFSFYFTFSLALFLASLFQSSLAAPSSFARSNANTPKVKDAMRPPPNWIDLGPAPPLHQIWLRIALPQARFSELERQLYEMSDPKNARYGQHLLKEQVTEFVRPDRRSVEAVDAWLAEYGITGDDRVRRSVAGDWVTILVPVAVAESMLDTVSKAPGLVFHVLLTVVSGIIYAFWWVVTCIVGVPSLEECPRWQRRGRVCSYDPIQPSGTPTCAHRTCAAYNVLRSPQTDGHKPIFRGPRHHTKHQHIFLPVLSCISSRG